MDELKLKKKKPKLFKYQAPTVSTSIFETEDPFKVDLNEEEWKDLEAEIIRNADTIIESKQELNKQIRDESAIYNQDKILTEKAFEGAYQEHVPITATMIDAAVSRVKRQIVSLNPLFRVKPQDPIDVSHIEAIEEHMEFQIKEQSDSMKELDQLFYQVFKHGVGILVVRWAFERRYSRTIEHYDTIEQFGAVYGLDKLDTETFTGIKRDLESGKPVDICVESNDIYKNNPEIELCHLEDFFIYDKIDKIENSKLTFRRLWLTWDQLQKYKNENFKDEDLDKFKSLKSDKNPKNQEEREAAKEKNNTQDVDYEYRPYEIFEGIFKSDLNDDGVEELYLVTFSTEFKKLIRFHHYPYAHSRPYFIPIVAIPREKSWRGYSIPEKTKNVQRLLDDLWSQIMNITETSAYPIIKARREGSFDPEEHPLRPFAVWWLRDVVNDVQFERLPNVSMQTVTLLQEALRFAELVTGIPFVSLGMASPKDERAPATKSILLRNEADIRIMDMIDRIRRDLGEAGSQFFLLNSQFCPLEDFEFRITNPRLIMSPYRKINRQAYMFRAHVAVEGASIYNSWESEAQSLNSLYMMIMGNPNLAQQYPEGIMNLVRDIAKRAGLINLDRYIPTPEILSQLRLDSAVQAMKKIELMKEQQAQNNQIVQSEINRLKTEGAKEFIAGTVGKQMMDSQVQTEIERIKEQGALEAHQGKRPIPHAHQQLEPQMPQEQAPNNENLTGNQIPVENESEMVQQ